jgi:hypothetical protein
VVKLHAFFDHSKNWRWVSFILWLPYPTERTSSMYVIVEWIITRPILNVVLKKVCFHYLSYNLPVYNTTALLSNFVKFCYVYLIS